MFSNRTPHARLMVAFALLFAFVTVGAAPPHFDLERSTPAADETVESVEAVTLWFTQVPTEGSVSVRLIDGSGDPLQGLVAKAHEDDGKVFSVATPDGLPSGSYTVAWRGIGADGHVVRGDFAFTVAAS